MRVTLPCFKTALHLTSLIGLLTLSFFLLVAQQYFSLPDLQYNWTFGLSGVQTENGFKSYAQMRKQCGGDSEHSKLQLCDFYGDFEVAGDTLIVCLVLLLVLEAVGLVHLALTTLLLSLSIRAITHGHSIPAFVPTVSRVLSFVQYMLLCHPVFAIFAVVCYPLQSRLPEVSAVYSLQAEGGLVVLGVKSALALLVAAALCICALENRRKNEEMLREKKDRKHVFSAPESEKAVLGGGSFDETRL